MIAVIKAVDCYLMSLRAAAEAGGKRWLFSEKNRKIDEDFQDPADAGIEAFLDCLDRYDYALVKIKGRRKVTDVQLPADPDELE